MLVMRPSLYILCASAVDKDPKLPADERMKLKELYASQAVKCLRKELERGIFRESLKVSLMKETSRYGALRGRADFKKLMQEVERNAKK